jgi:hypothetical protein
LTRPRLLLELTPHLERGLFGLDLSRADSRLALAQLRLGVGPGLLHRAAAVVEDPLGTRLGVTEGPRDGELVAHVADEDSKEGDQR